MEITQEFVDANPYIVLVLERFDFDKGDLSGVHYVHEFPSEYLVDLAVPDWMVWPNKEVAQFAADQFNKLYNCVKPIQESSYIFTTSGDERFRFYSNGEGSYGGYIIPINTIESNWFGAILAVFAEYNFTNDKIKKIKNVIYRALWGTNGKR